MKSCFRFFIFTSLAAVLFPALLHAQVAQVGTIAGEVTDETGSPLPGVTVELTSEERGVTRTALTDANGRYLFAQVPLGRYRVVATLSGFQSVSRAGNIVEAQRTTTVAMRMRLAVEAMQITVTGEVPIVDKTETAQRTRLSSKEFEKLPMGRSFQTLFGQAAGVVGAGNANVNGALSTNNLFMFDGVDVTDPTTGTFGTNLNFEAIQEVNIFTSGVSAEYGRAVGGIINVITKSGTNEFEGSVKYIASNDEWDEQNRTTNEVTGGSLAREKFDQLNDRIAYTLGGPVWRDRAWFFGTYEDAELAAQPRTTAVTGENYVQITSSPFVAGRITGQLTPSHNVWARYHDSPTNGFAVAYWGASATAELFSLTSQDQGADSLTAQWTGVFAPNLAGEAMYAENDEFIAVYPYRVSPLHGGAPHFSQADRKWYNGATFDGIVDRPRDQAVAAMSYYRNFGESNHNFKLGVDWQDMQSTAAFRYPTEVRYIDRSFDPVTRTFVPFQRQNFDPMQLSTSEGQMLAVYLRDKMELGNRLFIEAGARYEKQDGTSDIGRTIIDTSTVSPRFAASYDLRGDGKSIVLGTAARLYQFIILDLADEFAEVPQQSNYDLYQFSADTNDFEFVRRNQVSSADPNFQPNTDLDPSHVDELTLGFQQQIGNTMGAGVRAIWRQFGDLIDDVLTFNPDGSILTRMENYGPAEREYRALQLTFEKRFSSNWNTYANYTFAETEGNHFGTLFTELGNFLDAQCRSTDPTVGMLPCRDVANSSRKFGSPSFDRPHNLKFGAAYGRSFGPVNLTLGSVGEWISATTYEKIGTALVLAPDGEESGEDLSYFYSRRGSDRLPSFWYLDLSGEATWSIWRGIEVGVKGEVFNVTDQQEKTTIDFTTWCEAESAACATNRSRYGKASRRAAFQGPRSYRVTGLIRF